MKFVDNMPYDVRKRAGENIALTEAGIAVVQVVFAMMSRYSYINWFAAMFAIALGTIAWVILEPGEIDD